MYPAHIRETGERQTVREHCRNTAALAANALRPLGLEKSAYLATPSPACAFFWIGGTAAAMHSPIPM